MLNIIKERVGNALSIRLTGSLVGECVNLETLIGPTPAILRVSCKSLVRLNSNGVRAWIRYFEAVRKRGTQVILSECSPAIVEKLSAFKNFACGAEIVSIYVPYYCTGCKRELVGLFSIDELRRSQVRMPELACPSCSKRAEFDDLPHEYFRFLERDYSVKPLKAASHESWTQARAATASGISEPTCLIQRPAPEDATGFIRRVGA
jgi:hypothetical protein